MPKLSEILFGKKGKSEQVSRLDKGGQELQQQLYRALMGQGGGGAFGQAADYYRSLLDPNSQTFQDMAAPEMRQFNQDIIPQLSEQFAGMGSGALSSSGFRNAAVSAGTDLQERLAKIRSDLRQQAAQGLFSMGQQGLQPTVDNVYRPAAPGFMQSAASGLGQGLTQLGSSFMSNPVGGKTSPYGQSQFGSYGYNQPLSSGYDQQFRQGGVF